MRVLHVTEAMGGGVISSILAMVEATPSLDHHLLARARPGVDTGDDWAHAFASVHELPAHPVRAALSVRRTVRHLIPDVVHAHSSKAGAVARLALPDGPPVAYSPHCFAFERRDIGPLQRRVYGTVERLLAPHTDVLVAVAPREVDLGVDLGHREVAYVSNRTLTELGRRARYADPLRIAAVGRVCAQKDWRYLLHVKRYAETQFGLRATWEWLGGGDPEGERALRAAGVDVTGWASRDEVLARLADAQVYLHTAAWEAAPIAVLEAAELGLPLAVRAIPALESLDLPGATPSVVRLAERLATLRAPEAWVRAQYQSDEVARRHTRSIQAAQVLDAYARVVADQPAGMPLAGDAADLAPTVAPTVASTVASSGPAASVVEIAARYATAASERHLLEFAAGGVREGGR